MSERKTEQFVEAQLTVLGYPDDSWGEQASGVSGDLRNALKNASKLGTGRGKPEYVIESDDYPDYVIAIECKPEVKDHTAAETDALHYAGHLFKVRNVIAVAVSGDKNANKISVFLQPKGTKSHKVLPLTKILEWKDFVRVAEFDSDIQKLRWSDLMKFSADMHEFIRDNMGLAENEKPLLVSGTLLALQDGIFRKTYATMGKDITSEWGRAIDRELKKAEIPAQKVASALTPYQSILGKAEIYVPLVNFVKDMHLKVYPYMDALQDFDIIGQFYGEFLKYTAGDKKGLGIVLTPHHVTKLFAALSGASKNSRVLDICAGTGGFLISAMKQMIADAQGNAAAVKRIKHEGLIGVEDADHMYALAVSNMVLRGDGKANMYHDDCFKKKEILLGHKCDIALLNPPYSQTKYHELDFVEYMLDCLVEGGTGIAIVQVNRALENSKQKHRILQKHTLLASMTMHPNLFYKTGASACTMVFQAHRPHSGKTWFADWKDDGYVAHRNIGRIDPDNRFPSIMEEWVSDFKYKTVRDGYSVLKSVSASDEWCVENYMESDYSLLSPKTFLGALNDNDQHESLVDYHAMSGANFTTAENTSQWQEFTLADLFHFPKSAQGILPYRRKAGNTPYIGAVKDSNGVADWVDATPTHKGGSLTIANSGQGGVGMCFYQGRDFYATPTVSVLQPKKPISREVGVFLAKVIEQERHKFSFARSLTLARLQGLKIRLPAKNGTPDWEWMENYMKGLK